MTQALATQNTPLIDVLDRVLDKGVAVYGDVVLSVADIDLLYLNLRLVLSSIGTLEKLSKNQKTSEVNYLQQLADNLLFRLNQVTTNQPQKEIPMKKNSFQTNGFDRIQNLSKGPSLSRPKGKTNLTAREKGGQIKKPSFKGGEEVNFEPEKVERGLAKLVLIIVELLRKLMEKQAIRRVDAGNLNLEQIERLGIAFKRLEEKVGDLKKVFGLEDEELNLNLGPLGNLM